MEAPDLAEWELRLEGVSCSCSSPVTEVNLSLSCPERVVSNQILILQSRANLTWFLSLNGCHIQFLVRPPPHHRPLAGPGKGVAKSPRGDGAGRRGHRPGDTSTGTRQPPRCAVIPQSPSPPRCGPDRGGCSQPDAPGPAKPPLCHPHRSLAPTRSRPSSRTSSAGSCCPTRSRAWSPKPSRRTTASSPPTPPSPSAPASPWRSRSTVGPRRPSWAQGFVGVSPLSSPRPLPTEVLRKPPATPTPPAPTSDTLPHVLLLMLQPWKCTDDTMEIIIARSHLEVRAPPACLWGGLILLRVPGCWGGGELAEHAGGSFGYGWCFSLSPSKTW